MAKYINDVVMNQGLNVISGSAVFAAICNAQPTSVADVGTYGLGTVAFTDWTIEDGSTSGRKITAGIATLVVGTSGTIDHIGFYDADTLYGVGTIAPTAVTAAGTVITAAFILTEIRDIT